MGLRILELGGGVWSGSSSGGGKRSFDGVEEVRRVRS